MATIVERIIAAHSPTRSVRPGDIVVGEIGYSYVGACVGIGDHRVRNVATGIR